MLCRAQPHTESSVLRVVRFRAHPGEMMVNAASSGSPLHTLAESSARALAVERQTRFDAFRRRGLNSSIREKSIECSSNGANNKAVLRPHADEAVFDVQDPLLSQRHQTLN